MHPGLHFQTSCILHVTYIDLHRERLFVLPLYDTTIFAIVPILSQASPRLTLTWLSHTTMHRVAPPIYYCVYQPTRGFTYAYAWPVLARYWACALSSRDRLIDSLMHPGNPVFLSLSLKATALPRKYAPMTITPWYRQSDSTLIKNGRDRRQSGESSRRDCPRVSWKRTCFTI